MARVDTNSGSLPAVGRYSAMWMELIKPGIWTKIGRNAEDGVGRGWMKGSSLESQSTIVPP